MKKFIRIICFVIAIFSFCVIFNSCSTSAHKIVIENSSFYNFDNNNYWYKIIFDPDNYEGSYYRTYTTYATVIHHDDNTVSFKHDNDEKTPNEDYTIKELHIEKGNNYIIIVDAENVESIYYYFNEDVKIIKEPKR